MNCQQRYRSPSLLLVVWHLLQLASSACGFVVSQPRSTTSSPHRNRAECTNGDLPWQARPSSSWSSSSSSLSSSSASSSASTQDELTSPSPSSSSSTATTLESAVASNLAILYRAADSRQEDSDAVVQALVDLERHMRSWRKQDPSAAETLQTALQGDWQLVFTTGTKDTQDKYGKINYFPLKAVQSFRTIDQDPMLIENGIYLGNWPAIKFQGTMTFDVRKCRLEFDFNKLGLFNLLDISLGQGEAAQLGARSGLGSESNVKNAERDRKAFFNWISADDKIATARGAGGGLALWKRIG